MVSAMEERQTCNFYHIDWNKGYIRGITNRFRNEVIFTWGTEGPLEEAAVEQTQQGM